MLSHTVRRHLWAAAAAAVVACGGTTTQQTIGPSAVRCQIGLNAPSGAVPPSGSSVSLNIVATRDCTWAASSDAPWLSISPTSGQGNGAVAITVGPNAQPSPRSATVVVNDSSVTVRQEPAPCRFELGHRSSRIGFEGGRITVSVSTIAECAWRAGGGTDWARVATPAGIGAGTVEIEVSPNSGAERSVALTIADIPFPVVQDAAPGAPSGSGGEGPPPGACGYSIDPERATLRAAAGQGSLRVITESGCAWTASSGTSWIAVQRSSGSGPDAVTYQVSANTSTVSDRSGTLSVAGRTHRVTQRACELSLEPASGGFCPRSDGSWFTVTTDAGCTWNASSDVDWITITRTSGAGSSTVRYFVAENPIARDRAGRITVSGRTVYVIQQALGQCN